jgi:hypothetical protein
MFLMAVACTSPSPHPVDPFPPIPRGQSYPSHHQISESVLVHGGKFRCTLRFPSNVLVPGASTGVSFTLENVSGKIREVPLGFNGEFGFLELRGTNGGLLADTSHDHDNVFSGPPPISTSVSPSHSVAIGADDVHTIWPGPLSVTPTCAEVSMPPVTLLITAPGVAPLPESAITKSFDELAKRNPIFDRCRPPTTHTRSFGTGPVTVTRNGHKTTFQAHCAAGATGYPGFDIVTIFAWSPPSAPTPPVGRIANELAPTPDSLGANASVSVVWWRYAVTASSVTKIDSYSLAECKGSSSEGLGLLPC